MVVSFWQVKLSARGPQDPTEKLDKGESEALADCSATRAVSLQTTAV